MVTMVTTSSTSSSFLNKTCDVLRPLLKSTMVSMSFLEQNPTGSHHYRYIVSESEPGISCEECNNGWSASQQWKIFLGLYNWYMWKLAKSKVIEKNCMPLGIVCMNITCRDCNMSEHFFVHFFRLAYYIIYTIKID